MGIRIQNSYIWYMKNILLIPIVLLLITPLTSAQDEVSGCYLSKPSILTKLKWTFLKGKFEFRSGTSIRLMKNREFIFGSAACQSRGRWRVDRDTIKLNHLEIIHDDHANTPCYLPYFFVRKGQKLIGVNEGKYIEIMVRCEDCDADR